jgi:hypothetical protein
MAIKILDLRHSRDGIHKFIITFEINGGKRKTVRFGAKGYSDYTIHKDPARKKRYITRHKDKEDWADPLTAGALSRWILWNKPTFKASLADFKTRFRIK